MSEPCAVSLCMTVFRMNGKFMLVCIWEEFTFEFLIKHLQDDRPESPPVDPICSMASVKKEEVDVDEQATSDDAMKNAPTIRLEHPMKDIKLEPEDQPIKGESDEEEDVEQEDAEQEYGEQDLSQTATEDTPTGWSDVSAILQSSFGKVWTQIAVTASFVKTCAYWLCLV
ncbi:Hypothetical protein NTJ_14364 [Nesidiocoris tenuis]|uniref:Uncharacterized protein n=1 Tax=Nesidiocoris tenuis TaxID=355587 RepID=A0ABN7BAX4_9HEMI|nr:Hypothetical protein NTJ_14364 [Nesidiocoris tenuis]